MKKRAWIQKAFTFLAMGMFMGLEGAFVQDAAGATFADDLGALAPADDSWLAIGEGDDLNDVGPNLTPFADAGASVMFNVRSAGEPDAEGRGLLR